MEKTPVRRRPPRRRAGLSVYFPTPAHAAIAQAILAGGHDAGAGELAREALEALTRALERRK